MITLRKSSERQHNRRGKKHVWLTFYRDDVSKTLAGGFGALERLDEGRLPPGAGGLSQRRRNGDVVTYVREGTVAYASSLGLSGVVHAGEFQRRTATAAASHRETNASHADSAHLFQIGLRTSQVGLEPSHEQKRFSVAERRDGLCIVASPDSRHGSLRVHQDALVYSAVLHLGQHVVHELAHERCVWIHVVQGEVVLGDTTLTTGDGAGITAERTVSLTAHADSEILLLDIAD
jgi:redox-sensitive bicupin YhaK (pirin superfamily)